ncbi:hypothetical protein QUA81_07065 [Microcoleus sp. F6_B4]
MVSIQLIAHDFHLQLVDNAGWCSVFLFLNDRTEELGADSTKVVINRFLSVLDMSTFPELKIAIKEHQYACFIALFEKHNFGYARQTISGIELHFRNELNEPITTVSLSLEECKLWNIQLTQWLSSINK